VDCFPHFLCHFLFPCYALLPVSLQFDNLQLSNPNIGAHRLCARVNTHEMPPKKRSGNELLVEGPAQGTGAPTLETTQTTTQPPPSSEPQQTTMEVGRPNQPPQQPPNQAEVLAMNTSVQNTQHPNQPQNIEAQEDLEQDSKEEIEAIIEDELARLRQENERLRLMQEQMVRRKAMAKRAQAMQ
jgi:hypothetical protein